MKSLPFLSSTLLLLSLFGAILPRPAQADMLSQAQRDLYKARLDANDRGRFDPPVLAPFFPRAVDEPLAEAIITWDRLKREAYKGRFEEYAAFLRRYPNWPQEQAIRVNAERMVSPTTPMADRLSFFAQYPPVTGMAMLRYAEALTSLGRTGEARAQIQRAWTSSALTPTLEADIMARFGVWLSPKDHEERARRMLWMGQYQAAQRLLPLLTAEAQALALARLAARNASPDLPARLAALTPLQRMDAGLIYDQVQTARSRSSLTARQILASSSVTQNSVLDASRWLKLHLELAREAQSLGDWAQAYAIADGHNSYASGQQAAARPLAERQIYTDVEWLAGWAALKYLGRPDLALGHFQNFSAAVTSPVSQSRGDYWAGRAAEAAGRQQDAERYYLRAASHPDQFYGQLALERLGRPIALPVARTLTITAADRARFNMNPLIVAVRMLGEMGERSRQGQFMRYVVDQLDSAEQKQLLVDLSREIGRPELGVLTGTAARSNGEFALIQSAFPKLSLDEAHLNNWTMIHAITRQESRFDRTAVSRSGARGLMQLMPATAREQAGKLGTSYALERLTEDENYNILLGSTYYQRLLAQWGGNHVLAVASYNAGAGNVRRWVANNGDPRDGRTDVLVWIESIPFSETRNYVQRVMENAVVYDLMRDGDVSSPEKNRLSAYLGKSRPG